MFEEEIFINRRKKRRSNVLSKLFRKTYEGETKNSKVKRSVSFAMVLLFAIAQLLMPAGVNAAEIAQAADSTLGGTYYVAPDGSDSANGSQSAPFKTIAKAAEVAKAGDTVLVEGGTYNGQVTFSKSGTQSALITFRAASGERPKIVANGSKYAFDFAGQSYISVEGFDISGSQSHLFRLENASSNGNIVANNILHNTTNRGDGVRIMAAKNTQVLNNEMHHVQYGVKVERSNASGDDVTNTLIKGNEIFKPGVDCIYLAAPGVTVDDNNLHDNNATYSAGEHADGVQVYMKSYTADSKIVFSNNLIDLKDQPGSQRQCNSLMLENAGGITIFNNVINGRNEANGINLKSCPNSKVFNNTVVDTANSTIYVHKGSTVASSNVLVYNNITPGIKVLSDGSKNGSQTGNNLVGGDPQFVDKAAGDFKVKAGSPVIDKGYANSDNKLSYPETCMDGGERIVNGKIDIGAFEFGAKLIDVDDESETVAEETEESPAEQVVSDNETVTEETDSDTAVNTEADTDTDLSVESSETCETCKDSSCTDSAENTVLDTEDSTGTATGVDDGGNNSERISIDGIINFLKRFLAENQSVKQLIIKIRN